MTKELVKINNLLKLFSQLGKPAINSINASIFTGQVTGLVGPDGAGKTTLIRCIAGLLRPDSGEVLVNNFDSVKNANDIQQIISYMPQKFGLYEDLTVIENLNLYADLKNIIGEEREKSFKKLLSFTDLERFKNRQAGNLSGGMKQKLGLACSLIKKPLLLLLDEPSVGVDPISRRELWQMVQELIDEEMAVVWSTAYLDEAEKCDDVILINEGQIIFNGLPKELNTRVENRVYQIQNIENETRSILANVLNDANVIDAIIQGSNIRIVTKAPDLMPDLNNVSSTYKIIKVAPRFEDGFIDILGGSPKGSSALADIILPSENNEEAVVQADNLTKKFGSFTAANNISFSINKGEIFGLLGPNGAGKSTTFKMMCGLLNPTNGTAHIEGYDLRIAPAIARSKLGYMAQKFSLYNNLSVNQNLNFFAGIYGLVGNHKKQKIEKMIETFSLEGFLDSSAEELPLGYKQRLALACSVMHNPSILFLDEPTSGVDPLIRREFWSHINGMVEKGVTVIITTHFMDEAEYCDRIALVYRSNIIATGSPDALKNKVKSEYFPNPTLEDTFIELIKTAENGNEEAVK